MTILLLGSGGREHAFAWKLSQSALCKQLYIAPGNTGTALHGSNVDISPNDFEAIKIFCLQKKVSMVVVGPEDPLVNGIYDYFVNDESLQAIQVIGPSQQGAMLEGSKAFAKEFMMKYAIPTAAYKEFTIENLQDGIAYLQQHTLPIVLKADGLAAGKGVVICQQHKEAIAEFKAMLQDQKFGNASSKVVVEEFLNGIECSVFILTNGEEYVLLPSAKDYKRIGVGDSGLNTGGMGAVSPVPFVDEAYMAKVTERIILPTLQGIQTEKIIYNGFIFIGLISVQNEPYVIEYNCRMGDPETEVVLPRLENDLVELFQKLGAKSLSSVECVHSTKAATTIMLVSGGYPENYEKGKQITGLEKVNDSIVFHAGTKQVDDNIITNGGRVISITSFGDTLKDALAISNKNAAAIDFDGKYYRRDIGWEFV